MKLWKGTTTLGWQCLSTSLKSPNPLWKQILEALVEAWPYLQIYQCVWVLTFCLYISYPSVMSSTYLKHPKYLYHLYRYISNFKKNIQERLHPQPTVNPGLVLIPLSKKTQPWSAILFSIFEGCTYHDLCNLLK